MSLLLYAVAEQPAGGDGLGEQPLKHICHDGLVAIVSDWGAATAEPSEKRLWEYEQVVEQLMARQPVLPARFGSVLADEEAAHSMLRSRREQLMAALDRVDGAVELGVRCSIDLPLDTSDGVAYMRDRLRLHRRAHRVTQHLEPLRELTRDTRARTRPASGLPIVMAYLVERGLIDEFVRLVARLDRQLEDVELVCTGPWPPYSFAQEGGQ